MAMAEKPSQILDGVSETLLITLYTRALESQRPDGMIRDKRAVEIFRKMDCDFSHLKLQGHDEVGLIMRVKHFDSKAREFLERNPDAVVVHFGCGLDTRFERVNDGRVEWFDLDLPNVIELRRKYIGEESGRYHLFSGSAFEDAWMEAVNPYAGRDFLFMAEGVFPYFEEAQVKTLFLKIQDHFPGSELVCDAHTPFVIRTDNLQLALSGVKARLRWGLSMAGTWRNGARGSRCWRNGSTSTILNRAWLRFGGCAFSPCWENQPVSFTTGWENNHENDEPLEPVYLPDLGAGL
jgi:O-methyltransferase involved in polyketide biosynthesis